MNVKKILCLALALMMCCAMAVAEESDSDLQTQLDEANARIEELEAEVELYKPYYEAQIVAEYDGGIIFRDAALDEYSYYEDMFYSSYGINLEDYGLDTQYKQYALQSLVEEAVIMMNASELGLDQLDEETQADLQAQAEETQDSYISSVSSYFTSDDSTDEEVRESCIEYLDSIGYTLDYILESLTESYIYEQVYNYITADVEVTEEDIQTTYDELVESQQESFESDSTYNSTRNDGDLIVWNPEGYRAVKQVLIMFDDDQSTTYDDLTSTLSDLEDELATIQAAAEEETAEDTEEETTEDTEETEEEEVELRTEEEVQADIDAIQEELDALYDELMPTAQEVIDKFNEGTSFADLIDEYNEDTGMTTEPTATIGYAVSADSTYWDSSFTEGAMSIESVGGISEPICGSYGIYIIYYESDITAGAVDLEDVRGDIEASALETKISDTYNDTIDQWIEDANVTYYYDNLE